MVAHITTILARDRARGTSPLDSRRPQSLSGPHPAYLSVTSDREDVCVNTCTSVIDPIVFTYRAVFIVLSSCYRPPLVVSVEHSDSMSSDVSTTSAAVDGTLAVTPLAVSTVVSTPSSVLSTTSTATSHARVEAAKHANAAANANNIFSKVTAGSFSVVRSIEDHVFGVQ
jgi:hypothetical protein